MPAFVHAVVRFSRRLGALGLLVLILGSHCFGGQLIVVKEGVTFDLSWDNKSYTVGSTGYLSSPNSWNYRFRVSTPKPGFTYAYQMGHYRGDHCYWTNGDRLPFDWYIYRVDHTEGLVVAILAAAKIPPISFIPDGGPAEKDAGGYTRTSCRQNFSSAGAVDTIFVRLPWTQVFSGTATIQTNSLTVATTAGGTVLASQTSGLPGNTATVTASPAAGYVFSWWNTAGLGDGQISSTIANPAAFTFGHGNSTLSAQFTKLPPIPEATVAGSVPHFSETGALSENLVCIVHGYNDAPENWAFGMRNAIELRLAERGQSANWSVRTWDWSDWAKSTSIWPWSETVSKAEKSGGILAEAILGSSVKHVHFIAHSIGSRVVQFAIDALRKRSNLVVHATFLDAYTSLVAAWDNEFGKGADFAEHYFEAPGLSGTDRPLVHAANFDISALRRDQAPYLDPIPADSIGALTAKHFWPVRWYQHTIEEASSPRTENRTATGVATGFLTSKEAGSGVWEDPAGLPTNGHLIVMPQLAASSSTPVRGSVVTVVSSVALDVAVRPAAQQGPVTQSAATLTLGAGGEGTPEESGAVVYLVNTGSAINALRFRAAFSSVVPARAVLSVFVDDQPVASYDAAAWGAATNEVQIDLDAPLATGAHTFAWRLTSGSGAAASATVTNVFLEKHAWSEAATSVHTADTDRDFKLSLTELLRVIELYNSRNGTTRTGAYTVDASNLEDGFGSDPIRGSATQVTLAKYHSADSNHDGKFSLSELLRVIELYNYRSGSLRTGQYHIQADAEDGFDPGA